MATRSLLAKTVDTTFAKPKKKKPKTPPRAKPRLGSTMPLATLLALRRTPWNVRRLGVVVSNRSTVTGLMVVQVDGAQVTLPSIAGTYASGDVVQIHKYGNSWAVIGTVMTGGTLNNVDATPTYDNAAALVLPVETDSRSAERGWHNIDRLRQGSTALGLSSGYAFYGDLTQLGHVAGKPCAVTLTMTRMPGGLPSAVTPTLWLVAQATRPAGTPSRVASTPGPSLPPDSSATVRLPDAWADSLLNGAAGGLAIHTDTSPYVAVAGRADRADGMALSITYTVET